LRESSGKILSEFCSNGYYCISFMYLFIITDDKANFLALDSYR